jgi:hypothetical protein
MVRPIRARTFNEARYYLMVTPCRECGRGPWVFDGPVSPSPQPSAQELRVHCECCGAGHDLQVSCEYPLASGGPEAECINPTEAPSSIIDLGQWLGLFYLLIESAASEHTKPGARRMGYQAALCIAEALKFYDGELPPEGAFFSETTRDMFRRNPDHYARCKLQEMQSKLPGLRSMARRVARDERVPAQRWWRFWRR